MYLIILKLLKKEENSYTLKHKPITKRQILYDSTYMRYKFIEIENRLVGIEGSKGNHAFTEH